MRLLLILCGLILGWDTIAKPNILFILADDLGYSDVGCYGSEIATPNLDKLASNGIRFTQFYNTGRCWPTRAALMTGYYPQQIRMDPPRGRLPAWSKLLPHYLKPLGYRSYHSGKWHIQGAPKVIQDGGFDRSYKLDDHDRNFYPQNHSVDDVQLPPVARGSNYYTSTAITDFMLRCLKEHDQSKPFFAYVAFTVPHFPLQAPEEVIEKYKNKYVFGWDSVRERRHEKQIKLKLVDEGLSQREPGVVPHWNLKDEILKQQIGEGEIGRAVVWDSLNAEEKRFQARKMAIHAAMIDHMDQQIGRLLDQLKNMGMLENTIVMFASDNGASAEFLNRGDTHNKEAELGSGGSYLCLGPGWSTTANTPFRLHKSWVHEGGIATPFIVHWPGGFSGGGELRKTPGHVIDVVPTLFDILGLKESPQNGPALPGKSLAKAFKQDVQVERDYLFFHHENNRALRMGDWKIVSKRPDTNLFALYNLKNDRIEQKDLATKEEQRLRAMADKWQEIEDDFRQSAGALP